MCNNSFIIHLHRISEVKKGKKMGGKCSPDLASRFLGVPSEPLNS